ncbi:hypothetical protein H7849_05515 [Alloacidobacterium dinghuense]|uniref:Uncharacterized protein n=1 Tax=Alloacidobacterium dinghuense TaxID=2763107 RepID=A0A7G8BLJ0_9BACT|nr:hypothetical protein [Alloacidobacterium dinghuense]QNI33410.1 hypothetical protein H7849_05515 [Alloacidobacterium dinghuense]
MRIQRVGLLLWSFILIGGAVTQASAQHSDNSGGDSRGNYTIRRADSDNPRTASTEPLNSCGDSLSVALQQGTPEFPCWANIRTVERWNTAAIVSGLQPGSDAAVNLPKYQPSTFKFTLGGLSGFSFPNAGPGNAYGGLGAAAGVIERRRWQFMAEDGGGLADFKAGGEDYFVGLNRAAVRATGEINPRWTWQGTATSTFGTDAARVVAPLDFRQVGDAGVPAAETVVYGLHSGRVATGEESGKIRYEDSRRSYWDFSGTHTYTQYNADDFLVQTARARVEYLHALTPMMGFGVYGKGEHQTGPLDCSLGGVGLRWLDAWGTHASVNISGGVSGASDSCGKRVQFTGTAAVYAKLTHSTDLYLSGGRDLSDGILEHTVFLGTAAAGVRHSFHRVLDIRASLNGIHGVDPATKQSYHGTFVEGSLHYRMGLGFSQEVEVRSYKVAGTPTNDRAVAVFTLWWTPGRTAEATTARASLR